MLNGQNLSKCSCAIRSFLLCPRDFRLFYIVNSNREAATALPAVRPQSAPAQEYVDIPQYPEIQDLSLRHKQIRKKEAWHKTIAKLPTVEEKAIKLNMPRYYGYKVVRLNEEQLPYNCLPAIQHYTRTIFEENTSPNYQFLQQNNLANSNDSGRQVLTHKSNASSTTQENTIPNVIVESIRIDMQNAIEFALDSFLFKYPDKSQMEPATYERLLTQTIVEQVHRVLMNGLIGDYSHLQKIEVDYNPSHEAFWTVGGIKPSAKRVKYMENNNALKDLAHEPIDLLFQYNSTPYLALRHPKQLVPWELSKNTEGKAYAELLPRYNLDPRTLGYSMEHKHVTYIPGYWPNENSAGFGYLSYQMKTALIKFPIEDYGEEHHIEALHAHAIQSSFAWLLAQAHYNGFTTYNEITYPMNTQTIVTDGRNWSFYDYQLNTLLIHGRHVDENQRVNFCRGTKPEAFYEGFNEKGQLTGEGLNINVLHNLIKRYTQEPRVQRSIQELCPYLDLDLKYAANYNDDDKAEFLYKTHRHLAANRPRHLELPEIYMWEYIYKIKNKTRQMEPRRRFFELSINPWRRSLDQHQKEYIPKVLRPEGPKSRKKWKPTYYP